MGGSVQLAGNGATFSSASPKKDNLASEPPRTLDRAHGTTLAITSLRMPRAFLCILAVLLATPPALAQPSAELPPEPRATEPALAEPALAEPAQAPVAAPPTAVEAPQQPVAPQQQRPPARFGWAPVVAPPDASLPRAKRWYGAYTLATDGAAVALALGGAALDRDGELLLAASVGAYLVGGPIVHLAHGNPGRSLLSLGTRAGLPVTLAFLGVAAEGCGDGGGDFCGYGGALIGFGVGLVGAVVIDAAVIARDEVEPTPAIAPALSVSREGAWLGATGTF
jgi:hypothetical protein